MLPTPVATPLAQKYRSLIWSSLDCNLFKTALFYSERYFYSDQDNHDARHLLATSLHRCGQTHSAQNLVADKAKREMCLGCTEIYAQCCMSLGRYRQGQEALAACLEKVGIPPVPREPRASPDEAVLRCHAGQLALRGNLPDVATTNFIHAIGLNPYLWEAIEGLCQLGRCPDTDQLLPVASSYFQTSALAPQSIQSVLYPNPSLKHKYSGNGLFTPVGGSANTNGTMHHMYAPNQKNLNGGGLLPFRLDPLNGARDSIGTVDSSFYGGDASFAHRGGALNGPTSSLVAEEGRPAQKRTRSQMSTEARPEKKTSRGPVEALAAFRRSTRLLGGGSSKTSSKTAQQQRRRPTTRSRSGSDIDDDQQMNVDDTDGSSASSALLSPRSEPSPVPNQESEAASASILMLTRRFAKILRALYMYEPRAALEALDELPEDQKMAPWVSALVGRARFELNDYEQAARAFDRARTLDPYMMWDMDIYSTVLWHLQRDVQLSFLAQELVSIDDQAPQAWLATGNCFSLQKDHQQALSCFKRATQLDPRCAYGYALSGHEALASDDQESALQFFRTAIKTDPRHYPAWYGLGTVYLKMNHLRKAEYHFRKAIEISPLNAVLISCEGTVLAKRGSYKEALERFDRSLALAENSAIVKFKRVKVLMGLKQYDRALQDLHHLRDLAPDEANVPFVMGKLYGEMGEKTEATKYFTIARDLDPKLSGVITHLMENMAHGMIVGGVEGMDETDGG